MNGQKQQAKLCQSNSGLHGKMENKTYHAVGTAPTYNLKVTETERKLIPIHTYTQNASDS